MKTPLITDTHCHLDFEESDAAIQGVIDRAAERGVDRLITIGTSLERSRETVRIASQYPNVWATVGIHPDAADEVTDASLLELEQLASHQKVVAIGEIGLDFYHQDNPSPTTQREALHRQAALAARLELPMVIHSRHAHADMVPLLAELDLPYRNTDQAPGVIHCFEGEADFAEAILEAGYLISFTANLTYPKNEHLRELVATLPLDRLMVETDAPFLPPQRIRGQRNESANVAEVVALIAERRGLTAADVAAQTAHNASRLFGLPGVCLA